jgi:hypothetical protein
MSANEFIDGPLTLGEMIKIFSLLENPPEAAMVRKALRFYEAPQALEHKWGLNGECVKMLKHYAEPQHPEELNWMLKKITELNVTRLLEVGSSFGGTLKSMASVLPKGSQIVSVDLPIDETPKFLNPMPSLKRVCKELSMLGGNVELLIGNSHSPLVIEATRRFAPFDFGFIDGDHSYDGIKADWENYGPMCKVVGFHDIGGLHQGCVTFWRDLKASGHYRTEQCIAPGSTFGIGLVFRES